MGNVDILMVTETKIDKSFIASQFIVPAFTLPYRFDRIKDGEEYLSILGKISLPKF